MTPRTKQEVLDRFDQNPEYKTKAKETLQEPWFQAWLDAVLANMGPYSVDAPFDPLPHLQDRKDGGKAAVNHFLYRLVSLPLRATARQEEFNDEYIGFHTASSIESGTKAINKP